MGKLYGLYIKLSRDGKIKRTLSAVKGKGKLKDTTIAEELMSFMRLDLNEFSEVVNSLDAISESVEIQTEDGYEEVDMDKFTELLQKVKAFMLKTNGIFGYTKRKVCLHMPNLPHTMMGKYA